MFRNKSPYVKNVDNEKIYEAIDKRDYSEAVMVALDILNKQNMLPQIVKSEKSEMISNKYRKIGNMHVDKGNNNEAIKNYNKALMLAPKNSKAMVLAISSRSAIYFNKGYYEACIQNINMCLHIGCPAGLTNKLRNQKHFILRLLKNKNSTVDELLIKFRKYFDFDVKRNHKIPSASADIEADVESQVFKITAAKDIKVGTLLAIESSFVGFNAPPNSFIACHYCHAMSLNLIPCEGCCFVLFCNDICKEKCLNEYHAIECQIMDVLTDSRLDFVTNLALKAVLKFIYKCKSWKEVITESQNTGAERICQSTIEQIYDVEEKLSLLNFNYDRPFIHGIVYNASFLSAIVLHHLEKVPSFFPRSITKRNLAIRAVCKLMIYFSTSTSPIRFNQAVAIDNIENAFHSVFNYGLYSLTGKLKNSCNPNVLALSLNKDIALVAIQPIKRGTELTISRIGHWMERASSNNLTTNMIKMELIGTVCNCIFCTGNLELKHKNNHAKGEVKATFDMMKMKGTSANFGKTEAHFANFCEMLSLMTEEPFTVEYKQAYALFRHAIMVFINAKCSNVIFN